MIDDKNKEKRKEEIKGSGYTTQPFLGMIKVKLMFSFQPLIRDIYIDLFKIWPPLISINLFS